MNEEREIEEMRERIRRLEEDNRRLMSALDGVEFSLVKREGDKSFARRSTILPVTGVHNGEYEEIAGNAGDEGGLTTDYLYVGGNRLTIPTKTTNFLKVYLNGTTAPEWVTAMPETQDSDAEVFDVTKVRIHLSGSFGSG